MVNITNGRLPSYARVVIYGVEGIGKSTIGSMLPNPLFMDIEKGTKMLDVNRFSPKTYSEALQALAEIKANQQGFKTLVIDTADWLESLISQHVVDSGGEKINSIEDFGFGKGWVKVEETWRKFLDKLSDMPMDILILAHAELKKFEQPDEMGSYDRYGLKLSKKGTAVIKEWPDDLLFYNYKTMVSESENGKVKAQGQKRMLFTTHNAAWDAKNRHNLPETIPVNQTIDKRIMAIFGNMEGQAQTKTVTKVGPPMSQKTALLPKKESKPESEKLPQLKALMTNAEVTHDMIENFLIEKGAYPAATKLENFNQETLTRLVNEWEALVPLFKAGASTVEAELTSTNNLTALEELMKRDGITPEVLEAEVIKKKQGSGSYLEYPEAFIERLVTNWQLVVKNIKEA